MEIQIDWVSDMRNYKLTIAYDGSRYQGWQRQATTDNTIQYIIEWSLGKIVGYRVQVDGSGRTDSGVHARGQVASVKLSGLYDPEELKESLNRYLPEDIRILKVELVKNNFHARKSAKGKKYEYYIDCREKPDVFSRRYCYHYPEKLDIEAMRDATKYLIGRQEFCQFYKIIKIQMIPYVKFIISRSYVPEKRCGLPTMVRDFCIIWCGS